MLRTLLIAGLLLVVPTAYGQNLLVNSGFGDLVVSTDPPEERPGEWVGFFSPNTTDTSLTFVTISGELVLALSGQNATDGLGYNEFVGITQRVNGIQPGQEYTFQIFARNFSGAINGECAFRIDWIDTNGNLIGDPLDPSDPVYNTRFVGTELGSITENFALTAESPAGAVAANATIAVDSFTNDGQSPAFIAAAVDSASLTEGGPPPPIDPDVLLVDEFDATQIDTSLWFQPTGNGTFLGRTQMRPPSSPIEVSGGTAKLVVDTYNPSGFSFFGSEIRTVEVFELGEGLIFETRSRLQAGTPGGILGSLFSYTTNGFIRDEIDWELLSNDIPGSSDRILTNVFVDDDFSQPGNGQFVQPAGHDLTEFNTYRIEWRPTQIDWFINGDLVRSETVTVPDGALPGIVTDPLRIHLNAWAPDQFFGAAFNAGIQPVSSPAQNQRFTYEVDRVEIRRITPPVACVADLTTTGATLVGQPDFGVPDGAVDLDDLGYYLNFWLGGVASVADVTTTGATLEGQPGFGSTDGVVDLDDLGFFLNVWLVGCP
ncbi:MAG: glycoside hydrolase family 16 protein [Planctomycetota bacterium]